ncbi:hypothetical protein BTO20_06265 [Mycobacterium dioxanotrophicus]|jgi:beta-N-acetylhexosaminidase|uniref:beta-N-acetylhexosaminidase n=1 Tax=Mycobacterium dioxanotrophicus TaxID=482462 RepID=A0A1Y0BZ92_9MYCO|nr:glycoside hydrolase family 3 N-terminal domain-containing protein [Mycobacterium dioxanotrophicus]ART68243.1 hypothetical protein BTO20_06265 [Mycobacterium dioxanotrophicus]
MSIINDLTVDRPVEADAHAVLLPTVHTPRVDGWLESFLTHGGRGVFLASSAEEYAVRRIGPGRRRSETAADVEAFAAAVRESAGAEVIVAVDAESGGVQRLEHLCPPLPTAVAASTMSDAELDAAFTAHAVAARRLGVTMFLGPVVDTLSGPNAWLDGRVMVEDHTRTASVGLRYLAAAQRAGIIATAKHFPGHPRLIGDPVHERVALTINQDEVLHHLLPFRALVDGGAAAVMLGPVTVTAIDPESPAATSRVVVDLLRHELGFSGLVVSDDLSAESTMLGRGVAGVAVAAVAAGVQLMLVPGGSSVSEVADGIAEGVRSGRLSRSQLARAADAVRRTSSLLTRDAALSG